MKPSTIIIAIIAIFAMAVFGLIVNAAIQQGGWNFIALIIGVAVLSAIGAWLMSFGVKQKERLSEIDYKKRHDQNQFVLEMAKQGLIHPEHGYIPRQISAPKVEQGVSQIIFNPNALRESAVNLLLLSMRQCGADQNRIASGPECAAAGVNGYTPRTWSKIIHEYLEPRYGVVTVRGATENGGGTFVQEGTVEALYHRVVMDSGVDALPGVTR